MHFHILFAAHLTMLFFKMCCCFSGKPILLNIVLFSFCSLLLCNWRFELFSASSSFHSNDYKHQLCLFAQVSEHIPVNTRACTVIIRKCIQSIEWRSQMKICSPQSINMQCKVIPCLSDERGKRASELAWDTDNCNESSFWTAESCPFFFNTRKALWKVTRCFHVTPLRSLYI